MSNGICQKPHNFRLRVAFFLFGGPAWQGGRNYLLNLLKFLVEYESSSVQPVLYLPLDLLAQERVLIDQIKGIEVSEEGFINNLNTPSVLLRTIIRGLNYEAEDVLTRDRIDVVFEVAQFIGKNTRCASIAWLPDLQHIEMPHLFSFSSRLKRDVGFRMQIRSGRKMVVSSAHARSVAARAYPTIRDSIHVVNFAVKSAESVSESTSFRIMEKYSLPEQFLFLPNQFWRHKNHSLVLDALLQLRNLDRTATIVCTGATKDMRDESFFEQLLRQRDRYGLQDSFRILGQIPYADSQILLQSCKAMLNPSVYEGWSTTVEEAKALNVPMLLSDIEVHKEQAGNSAWFFIKNDSHDLAEKIILATESVKREIPKRKDGLENNARACAAFAARFKDVAFDAFHAKRAGS